MTSQLEHAQPQTSAGQILAASKTIICNPMASACAFVNKLQTSIPCTANKLFHSLDASPRRGIRNKIKASTIAQTVARTLAGWVTRVLVVLHAPSPEKGAWVGCWRWTRLSPKRGLA
eukprot:3684383-Amphidinium_carterae.1